LRHREWGGELDYEFIVDHKMVMPGLTLTVFSDGTKILVNKSGSELTYEDVTVASRGYEIIRK
jgi:hypothetical protein